MKGLFVLILSVLLMSANAQKALSVEEAVSIALKNNYGILVARTEVEIAKISNSAGNAGMLPSFNLNGTGIYEVNRIEQELPNGSQNTYPSLSTSTIAAGAELSWTLFNGGKMFITKDKLTELQNLSEIELYKKTLQTQYEVTAAYYDIVKQKQQLASLQEVLSYNEERVRITEAGFAAGTLARPDLLQAEIDRNVTLENIVAQQFIIGTAKKYLLLLLGSCDFTDFDVVESISSDYFPDNTKLAAQLDTANTGNLSFRSQMEIARLSIEENKRAMFPEIRLTAGYYLSQYNNSDGNVLRNYSLGPLAGASLKIPIFNGGTVRRQKAISELEFETACYQLESYKKQVNTELQNALSNFENQKQLIEIEKENNILAKENIEISIQRLAQGETTSLEVHLAQESFMQSCTRLINFLYNLKLAETQLKQLVSEM